MSQPTVYNTNTKKFKDAIALLVSTDVNTFKSDVLEPLALHRDESIPANLKEVAELVKHIVERAAQKSLNAEKMVAELRGIIDDDRLKSIARYYQVFEQQLLKKLERSPVVPSHLNDVHWRLHLKLAEDRKEKILEPTALFQFDLVNPDGEHLENFNLEFEHEDLYHFFSQIENIQEQLDALS